MTYMYPAWNAPGIFFIEGRPGAKVPEKPWVLA
jgi:hypothetical protein